MYTTSSNNLGKVGGALAEQLAYLSAPARIDGEILYHERAIAAGDRSEATRAQLADWRAVEAAQARLVGAVPQQAALAVAGQG